MSNDFNQFRFGMGVLAESLRMFYSELLKNGFSKDEAMELTTMFMAQTFNHAMQNKEENNNG